MKYEITLNGRIYEIEVELSSPMGMAEFAAYQPAPPDANCQGLFNQVYKEVTFCGLLHGADA